MDNWFKDWFNKDYLKLYSRRNEKEALVHVNFLLKNTGLQQGKALDLGCGSGRHSIALAKKGFSVTGVDLSKTLIDEAKKQSQAHNINWVVSDFTHMNDTGDYDLVLCMFTSFGYSTDDEENSQLFSSASSNMNKQGYFFLDTFDPEVVKKTLIPNETKIIEGEEVLIERRIVGDRVIKEIHFPTRHYTEKVKLYSKEQIEKMAQDKGMKISKFWNGYGDSEAKRLLFLFQHNDC
jgi:2-polyprenyl-3-methyl-5-hydroxy-6-metoxy-1,4-benzoquinol methylase